MIPDNVLYYLIYPSVVAVGTSLANYLATKTLARETQNENDRKRAKDLIDRLIAEIDKVDNVLDKLNDDLQKKNYFDFNTIYLANPIIAKLNSAINDILVLSDDKLRQLIIEEIDKLTSLVNDINNVESNPVKGWQDLNKLTQERETEYRAIQLKLLEQDIYYDSSQKKFKYINKKTAAEKMSTGQTDAKLGTVEGVLQSLLKDLQKSQQDLDSSREEAKNRRTYLALNILSVKQSLKDLMNKLKTL